MYVYIWINYDIPCVLFEMNYLDFEVRPYVYVTHIDGLAQDSNICIANALEILQSCTKLYSIYEVFCECSRHDDGI